MAEEDYGQERQLAKRYVVGESTRNWRQSHQDPTAELLAAIERCEADWGDDPAYKDVCFHLDRAEQELDLVRSSPDHRAALRGAEPNHAGQLPRVRSEGLGG